MNYSLSKYLQYEKLTKTILNEFNVTVVNEGEKGMALKYPYFDGTTKVCCPFLEKKWATIPSKIENVKPKIFGYNQLPKRGDILFITGGEKDVLTLYASGYPSICFNSETTRILPKVVSKLKERFSDVILLFDNDKTGRKQSMIEGERNSLPQVFIPCFEDSIKDITDYFALGKSKQDFESLVRRAISEFYRKKDYYPASELEKVADIEDEYIVPEILPKGALVGIVGGSDTGKSLLSLQFAIKYVLGKDYLGKKVIGGNRALYCSFEDDLSAVKRRINLLTSILNPKDKHKVGERLLFKHSPSGLIDFVDSHMLDFPDTGLLILDTFSEVLEGKDINSVGDVRSALRPIHDLILKYNFTVLFLHHINKSSEKEGRIGKTSILGSQAIESKARLVFGMRKSEKGIRTLSIIKGNEVSEEIKSKALNLKLNPENLWFEKTEYIKSFSVGDHLKNKVDWEEVFGESLELKSKDIVSRLTNMYGIGEKSAQNLIHRELKDFGTGKLGWYHNPKN